MKNKKAALMTFLVIAVALVFAVVVILFFWGRFDWKGEIDKQACHQTVIYKATIPTIQDQKLIDLSLNCKTEKICISLTAKGNCDEDYKGERYENVKIKGSNIDNEINEIIAEKSRECWAMMGQGKVWLYSREAKDKTGCFICTRIAFDKDLKEELKEKSNGKIKGYQKYLTSNNIPGGSETYWQFLTNSNNNYFNYYSEDDDFLTTEPKAIVWVEVSKGAWQKWLTRGGGVAAGALIGSIVPGPGTVIGAGIGGVIGFFATEDASEKIDKFFATDGNNPNPVASSQLLVDYTFEDLSGLECRF